MWNVNVVLGGQHGDEGKGKITVQLLEALYMLRTGGERVTAELFENFPNLTKALGIDGIVDLSIMDVRFNGGANAGHTTVFPDSKGGCIKVKTRSLPSGAVIPGCVLVIGPGCAIHYETLKQEIKDMADLGIHDIKHRLFIAGNATVVTNEHIAEDAAREAHLAKDGKSIGTTKNGIGVAIAHQAYRDGPRVKDCPEFSELGTIVDTREMFMKLSKKRLHIVCEGAQSVMLDPKEGDYPYVTSGGTHLREIYSVGIPMTVPVRLVMVMKAYHTYVGDKKFQPDDEVFRAICEVGHEYGVVTGRRRQANYLDLDMFSKEIWSAMPASGLCTVVFNKYDVLEEVAKTFDKDAFGVIVDGETHKFDTFDEFRAFIEFWFMYNTEVEDRICWSCTPESDFSLFDPSVFDFPDYPDY
jgi:adenylosuccinate synthase